MKNKCISIKLYFIMYLETRADTTQMMFFYFVGHHKNRKIKSENKVKRKHTN